MLTLTDSLTRHLTINPQAPLGCLIEVDWTDAGELVVLGEVPDTESPIMTTHRGCAA